MKTIIFTVIMSLLLQDTAFAVNHDASFLSSKLSARSFFKFVEKYADENGRQYYLQSEALDGYLREIAGMSHESIVQRLNLLPEWIKKHNFINIQMNEVVLSKNVTMFPIDLFGKKAELYIFHDLEKIEESFFDSRSDFEIARNRGYWIKMTDNRAARTATKPGYDQSPVPDNVVTSFIKWLVDNGAVISETGEGIKVIKNVESLELREFKRNGYTVSQLRNAVTFIYNAAQMDNAYILRDAEGNIYVTEMFYDYYKASSYENKRISKNEIKFQLLLHEVFEQIWNKKFAARKVLDITQSEIDELWSGVFERLAEFGMTIAEEQKVLYRDIFTRTKIEEFNVLPLRDTAHVLAELAEKLASLINSCVIKGKNFSGFSVLKLAEIDKKIRLSDLDRFLNDLELEPLVCALKSSISAILEGGDIEQCPDFEKYINKHKVGTNKAIMDLMDFQIAIFLKQWHKGLYTDIREENLKSLINKITNSWLKLLKEMNVEKKREEGDLITTHYSAWVGGCTVESVVIKENRCYISLDILSKKMGFLLSLEEEDHIVYDIEDDPFQEVKYDTFLLMELCDLKGELDMKDLAKDPLCLAVIQEMLIGLGWEMTVNLFLENSEQLDAEAEDINEFLHIVKAQIIEDSKGFTIDCIEGGIVGDNLSYGESENNEKIEERWKEWQKNHIGSLHVNNSILALAIGKQALISDEDKKTDWLPLNKNQHVFRCAYPKVHSSEYTSEDKLPISIEGPINKDLINETISVLQWLGQEFPNLNKTLIENLIERIRERKVFWGRHFLRVAVGLEVGEGETAEHFIAVNKAVKGMLSVDLGALNGKKIRAIFLASILLGQEAQIYIRQRNGSNWDEPEFDAAYVAQASELQVITLFRDNRALLEKYILFIESLTCNCWGDVNLVDLMKIHCGVMSEGSDYQFIEGSIPAILGYRELLSKISLFEYDEKNLQSADISKILNFMSEIGLAAISTFSDIPPAEIENTKVVYDRNVSRATVIKEIDLINFVKEIYVPFRDNEIRPIGNLIDNGVVSGLNIEVKPNCKKITITLNLQTLEFHVTVPEVKAADELKKYCQLFNHDFGNKYLIITDAYLNLRKITGENIEIIKQSVEYLKSGSIDKAERLVRNRLRDYPKSIELVLQMAQAILPAKNDPRAAIKLMYSTLKDPRLYKRSTREILFRLIDTMLALELVIPISWDSHSISDISVLMDIARREMVRHKQALEGEVSRMKLKQSTSEEEERSLRLIYNTIMWKSIFLRYNRGYNLKCLQLGKQIEGSSSNEIIFLISKFWISVFGGESLTEDEISRIFEIHREKQKANPLDFTNLAVWGQTLFYLWKYKYPERKEYLEEAEKRFEQYVVTIDVHLESFMEYTYYLGLIKYYLGKKDEAQYYLQQFFNHVPDYIVSRVTFLDGKLALSELNKENIGAKTETDILRAKEMLMPKSDNVVCDLIDNYFDSAISSLSGEAKDKFSLFSRDDKARFMHIYLRLLREDGNLKKAYKQALEWLDGLDTVDIDLIEELVKISVVLDKYSETLGLIKTRVALIKERDLILAHAEAIYLRQKERFGEELKLLNSVIEKYKSKLKEMANSKVLVTIFSERADLYMHMGQFTLAKMDWDYIRTIGGKPEGLCRKIIAQMDELDKSCRRAITKITDEVDFQQYPEIVIERMNEILEIYPHNKWLLKARNMILASTRHFSEAEEEYQMLIELYPSVPEFKFDIAICALLAQSPKAYDYLKKYEASGGDISDMSEKFLSASFYADKWEEVIRYANIYIEEAKQKGENISELDIHALIMLITTYSKLERWEDLYNILNQYFVEEKIGAMPKEHRGNVAKLFMICCLYLITSDNPDWETVEEFKHRAELCAKGLEMANEFKNIDDEIEVRKLELEEKKTEMRKEKTIEDRKRQNELRMRTIKNRIHELKQEIIEADRFKKIKEELDGLLQKTEEEALMLNQDAVFGELDTLKSGLAGILRETEDRITKREGEIEELKGKMSFCAGVCTDCIAEGSEIPKEEIIRLVSLAQKLNADKRQDVSLLIKDLQAARELAREAREKRDQEERLKELDMLFLEFKQQVEGLMVKLEALHPKERHDHILDSYRRLLAGFLKVSVIRSLRENLTAKNWPEEFKAKVISIDNLFMGIYGQQKGRKKLTLKGAFESEISDAFREIENTDIESGECVIRKHAELRMKLLQPIERVLRKYKGFSDFTLTQKIERNIRRRAEEIVAEVIRKMEERNAAAERTELEEEAQREEALVDRILVEKERRENIIQQVIDEWTEVIENEIKTERRKDVDFGLIRDKGESLNEYLKSQNVFLTYEEASKIQNIIMRVINPGSSRRFAWEKVYPVVQAITMFEAFSGRAKAEVDNCFNRPDIDSVDEEIFNILNNAKDYPEILEFMKNPAQGVKRLLRKRENLSERSSPVEEDEIFNEDLPGDPVKSFWIYWNAVNNGPRNPKNWVQRFGRAKELMDLGIISDPKEIIMLQIHLLKQIYTEDPANSLNPDGQDYPVRVAMNIARVFAGKKHNGENIEEGRQFIYDLENTRLKFIPRSEPFDKEEEEEADDTGLLWIRKNLGVHRNLTADETKKLILLAQKGNPYAVNILKQAHAITILNEAKIFARRTGTDALYKIGDYIQNGIFGFHRAVLSYGFNREKSAVEDTYFGLYRINATFLSWARMPVKLSIERNSQKESKDIENPIWLKAEKKLLAKAREQVQKDIRITRVIMELLAEGMKGETGEMILIPSFVKKLALVTGLKPLAVIALFADCDVEDLNLMAAAKLKEKLKTSKPLINLAKIAGMKPPSALIDNLNLGLDKKGKFKYSEAENILDGVFGEIVREKGRTWFKNEADRLALLGRIFLNMSTGKRHDSEPSKDLKYVWWIERKIKEKPDGEEVMDIYRGYFTLLNLVITTVLGEDISNSDIAPVVEYMVSMSVDRQFDIDSKGIHGVDSLDSPIGEDGDATVGERIDLSDYVEQETPEEDLDTYEAPSSDGIRRLSRDAFYALRKRVIDMVDKYGEIQSGNSSRQLQEIRPVWEKAIANLEAKRAEVVEIETKIEKVRKDKLQELEPILTRMEYKRKEYEGELKELEAKNEREKRELLERYRVEIEKAMKGKGNTPEEKIAHWTELYRRVLSEINPEKEAILKEYEGTARRAEEKAQLDIAIVTKSLQDTLKSIDEEIARFLLRQAQELDTAERSSKPAGFSGKYPDFPSAIGQEKGSAGFNKEFWELIIKAMSYLTPAQLLEKLEAIKTTGGSISLNGTSSIEMAKDDAEIFCRILSDFYIKSNKFYSGAMHPFELICTIFMPLSFDRRLWELIDNNEVDLRGLNGRLHQITQKRKPQIEGFYDEGYGVGEAELFSEQIVVLMKIVEQYKSYLARQAQAPIDLTAIKKKHVTELGLKQEEARQKREEVKRLYDEKLIEIEREKQETLQKAGEDRERGLVELENKKEIKVIEARKEHAKWKKRSRQDQVELEKESELKVLARKYLELKNIIESELNAALAPLQKEYEKALAELERRTDAQLRELEEAVREEKDSSADPLKENRLTKMQDTLFTSERYLLQWHAEEKEILMKLEEEFSELDRKYQELEQQRRSFERAKNMYLDYVGLSSRALEADHRMTLDIIAKDPRYAKEDGTSITRERVRQILRRLQLNLLVFSDLDDFNLEYVGSLSIKEINQLHYRFNDKKERDASLDDNDTDEMKKSFLFRRELIQLLVTIIESQKTNSRISEVTARKCLAILQQFITKNNRYVGDAFRIVGEAAKQIISKLDLDEDTLLKFEERMGEARIELLKDKEAGTQEKVESYKYSIERIFTTIEKRFSPMYNLTEEYQYFPLTDKNWIFRDEIIRLGLTYKDNLSLRERIVHLLDQFIETQNDLYPESDIENIVKELSGLGDVLMKNGNGPSFGHTGNAVDIKILDAYRALEEGKMDDVIKNVEDAIRMLVEVDFDVLDHNSFPVADMVNQVKTAVTVLEKLKFNNRAAENMLLMLRLLKEKINGLDLKFILGTNSDIGMLKNLPFGIKERKRYELRYNKWRLSGAQIELLNRYCCEMNKKYPNLIKIAGDVEDWNCIFKIACLDDAGVKFGEGKIKVEGDEVLDDCTLRVIGLLNIAFAASNIPFKTEQDNMNKYSPLIAYIKTQYKSITGVELFIPDSPIDMRKALTEIIIPMPRRIDLEEAEKLNKFAEQLLTSA